MADASSTKTGAERRDSPRVPMRFWVRDAVDGGSFEERNGDLATGGVFFAGALPGMGDIFEIRFKLPGHDENLVVKAELLRVKQGTTVMDTGVHLRFVDLPVTSELAIARYLDDLAQKQNLK